MRVLVAVDLREGAKDLVGQAIAWAEPLQATVDLIYVDEFHKAIFAPSDPVSMSTVMDVWQGVRQEMAAHLYALMEDVPPRLRGEVTLCFGTAATEIVHAAADHDAVILATHHRAAMQRLFLGSVAARVVRRAPCSVVVLQVGDTPTPQEPRPEETPMRLLLAVDANEATAPAIVDAAAAWAVPLDARLDVAFVDEYGYSAHLIRDPDIRRVVLAEWDGVIASHRAALDRLTERIPEPNRGRPRLLSGRAGHAIVEAAPNYDAVVVATHGHTGLKHTLLGSVAERVIRQATGPVIVLRIDALPDGGVAD